MATMRTGASAVVSLVCVVGGISTVHALQSAEAKEPVLGHRSARLISEGGLQFKDVNHDGKLEPYEDWRKPAGVRAADLVRRMSIEDMAGVMVHGTLPTAGGANAAIGIGAQYDFDKCKTLIDGKRINTFITRLGGDPENMAESANRLQELAEATRFGIPLTISTDPRNNFLYVPGASVQLGCSHNGPRPQGWRINDSALTLQYAKRSVRSTLRSVFKRHYRRKLTLQLSRAGLV